MWPKANWTEQAYLRKSHWVIKVASNTLAVVWFSSLKLVSEFQPRDVFFTIERKQVPLISCRHMTLRLARSLHLLSSCPIHVRDPLPNSVVQRVLMHVMNLFDQFFKVFLSVCVSVCVCIPSFLFLSTSPCFLFLFSLFLSCFSSLCPNNSRFLHTRNESLR